MKFGPVALDDAVGAVLAHSAKAGAARFKKGRVLSSEDVQALQQAGLDEVIAARLEPGDIAENEAAERLAAAVCGDGLTAAAAFTGRVNLHASRRGLLLLDHPLLERINLVHQDLTVATLEPYSPIEARQIVATVKVIPFAVNESTLAACMAAARASDEQAIRWQPFKRRQATLIQTRSTGVKESVLDKTNRVMAARLAVLGAELVDEQRCDHDQAALSAAIGRQLAAGTELILIAGASAIVDRRDVIPAAIAASGGTVEHLGMPVDPGNLLLLGYCSGIPVVGLPGCARSPKFNGLDKVLPRLVADLPVTGTDIMRMGVGGLLKETATRGAPRSDQAGPIASASAPRIAALILAAGQSRRMGEANKLLAPVAGQPMVAGVAATVAASGVSSVLVVTGHQQAQIEAALAGREFSFVHNPAYAQGISTSLKAGLAALPEDIDGVVVCLGDMPELRSEHIDRLIAAFDPVENRAICVPTHKGKRGNPVLWSRRLFGEMREVAGDTGAKHLLGEHDDQVCEVAMTDGGVLLDIDTPPELDALHSRTVAK